MDRREFLAMMAAGGVVTAAGIWMPGQKLISIPRAVYANTVTLGGFHDFQEGDYIQFSPDMTASEVRFRQYQYNTRFPEHMKAVREAHINGLYRAMSVALSK